MNSHPSSPLPRRHFLRQAVGGATAAALAPSLARAADAPASAPGKFGEPAREIPLNDDADVIVCGAGPAGVSAAITAARAGAKVRLFEWRGCLGGVWTAGLLGYLLDFDKPGFARELVGRTGRARHPARHKPLQRLLRTGGHEAAARGSVRRRRA